MRSSLDIVYETTKKSPRRQATLEWIKLELGSTTVGIRTLCPTRWTVRAEALQSILSNYELLQTLWEESLEFVQQAEMRSRIMGVSVCMKKLDFFFGVVLGELLLHHSDNLSKTLQAPCLSAADGQKIIAMTVQTLQSLRENDKFELFWSNTLKKANDLGIDDPKLPRRRKTPRRYEVGTGDDGSTQNVVLHYRAIFYEAIDLITTCIKLRFDQPGYRLYRNLEDLLVKAANKEEHDEELEAVCRFDADDLNRDQLKMQLGILASILPQDDSSYSLEVSTRAIHGSESSNM